jgi:3-dehydroquinate dehydratase-2
MKNVLVVHGPNLNLLGERNREIYGSLTLQELNFEISQFAASFDLQLRFFQSNCEGALIDFIHAQRKWADGMVINPAGYTHTSVALRDAIDACQIPTVEVHLSNIETREPFRQVSLIKDVCVGQVMGLGVKSYTQGLELLIKQHEFWVSF